MYPLNTFKATFTSLRRLLKHQRAIGSIELYTNLRWLDRRYVEYSIKPSLQSRFHSRANASTARLHSPFYLGANNADELVHRSRNAIAAATSIVSNLRERSKKEQLTAKDLVYVIDNISNILCTIADPCELLRHVHPCEIWRSAANTAVEDVTALISQLNIDEELYVLMNKAHAESRSSLNHEESLVFNHMIESMRHQGVGLPPSEKEAYLELQRQEALTSFELADSRELKHLAVKSIYGRQVPPDSAVYSYILRNSPDEEVRRMIWEAQSQSNPDILKKLLRLRTVRSSIARTRRFNNYAECAQRECILNKPEDVERFIHECASSISDEVKSDLQELSTLKSSTGSKGGSLNPWDLDYFIGAERDKLLVNFRVSSVLLYFERLLFDLFGITLVRDTSEALWHPLVAKFILVKRGGSKRITTQDPSSVTFEVSGVTGHQDSLSSADEVIAHLYMDLFSRKDKANICAQFTVRCSKLLDPIHDISLSTGISESLVNVEQKRDTLQYVTTKKADNSLRQVPATTIVCSYPIEGSYVDISDAFRSTYIDVMAAQTLFHELGHTVHALCSFTTLQHLSGNRGGVDFAEFSSHLFELYFADGIQDICKIEGLDKGSAEKAAPMLQKYRAIDTARMALMALLDLKFYNSRDELRPSDVNELLKSIQPFKEMFGNYNISELLGLPAVSNFEHIIHYGGTYFCYLYSRVLAIKIWRSFDGRPRDRSTGTKLHKFFMKGSIDASLSPLNELAGMDLSSMTDELFLD